MKWKQILAGVLSVAMVATGVPLQSEVTQAEEAGAVMRWEGEKLNTQPVEISEEEAGAFKVDLDDTYRDLAFDFVFKFNDSALTQNTKQTLATLVTNDEEYLSLWIQPIGTRGGTGYGFDGTGVPTGDNTSVPEFSKDGITDTKWHKLTYLFTHDTSTGEDKYIFTAYLDGKDLLNGGWDTSLSIAQFGGATVLNKFFGDSTDNPLFSQIYLGKSADGVAYTHGTIGDLEGTIKYVEARAESHDSVHNHLEHQLMVGDAIRTEFDELKTKCEAVATNQGKYTAESVAEFKEIWESTNQDAANEWDMYNAVDDMNAAIGKLVEDKSQAECGCSVKIGDITIEPNVEPIELGDDGTKTVTLSAEASLEKDEKCQNAEHQVETVECKFTAVGADATISGKQLTVKKTGYVTVTATATVGEIVATKTREIRVVGEDTADPVMRWENPMAKDQPEVLSDSEAAAFKAKLDNVYRDLAFDFVFKFNEETLTKRTRQTLATLVTADNEYLSLWIQPTGTNGGTGYGFDGTGVPTGDNTSVPEFSKTGITDTKWHKLTYLFTHDTSTGEDKYIFTAYLDGTDLLNGGWDASLNIAKFGGATVLNRFFGDGTDNPLFSQIYLGKSADGVAYTHGTIGDLEGTIKYVEVRAEAHNRVHDHLAHHQTGVGAAIQTKYNDLKTECLAVGTGEKKYTPESVEAFNAIWTGVNQNATGEWDIYNAVDDMNAALKALVPDCGCTVTITGITLAPADDPIALEDGPKTVTLSATASGTKGENCQEEGHVDSANVPCSFKAEGAGASITENNKLTVSKSGCVTVTATATFNGRTATTTKEINVTTKALRDLNSYIAEVEEQYKEQGDYADETWAALQSALEEAKNLQEATEVDDSQINQKKNALEGAVAALKTKTQIAKEELTELCETVAELGEHMDDYDADSWNELKKAHDAAIAVLENANADEAALKKAYEDLNAAYGALETKAGKAAEALDAAVSAAQQVLDQGQGSYSDQAWNAFKEALEAAQNHGSNLTAEQLNGLLASLKAAQDALTEADPGLAQAQENLKTMLADAKKTLDAGKGACPDAVWSAFQNAYNAANAEKDSTDAAKLATLYNTLKTALANVKSALAKQPGGQTAGNLPKVGSQHTVGKLVYQVKTSTATDKTVMVVKATSKTQKKITIPATVKIEGQAYKVVEIKANAFAKNKKLKTVKIGANVVKIGKKAFFNCAKLKNVNIKAKKLKTIGKQAFAKINKKATIKVPKKQKNALKKKLKKAKTIKSAKIK